MHIKSALFLMVLANPAWATCGGYEQTFLYCEVVNSSKTISVCHDDGFASYRFGSYMGTPELELIEDIATLDYTPWPGAGDTIWEDVAFSNEGYTYAVFVAIKRTIPDDREGMVGETHFGGVTVRRGDAEIANLTCEPDTIYMDSMSSLSWAKNRLGYSWNVTDEEWVALPD